jgi:hypothetical protein
MGSRTWSLISLPLFALSLAVSGCSCGVSHERDVDAGPGSDVGLRSDAPTTCSGSPGFFACVYCGGDVGVMPICEGGEWVCPEGTMPPDLCPPTCWGPPPRGDCTCDFTGARPMWDCPALACGPDVAGQPCNVEGELCGACCPSPSDPAPFGPFACTGGRWSWFECEPCPPVERQPCPAVRPIGAMCANEGQLCGDACCDTATICDGGVWTPGPIADCAACFSYACGPGTCRGDEACASLGCPGDEQCLPIPDGCTGCGCLELPAGATCEERDGHLFVSGGDCA